MLRARRLTIRGMLLLFVAVAMAYVLGMTLVVALVIAPSARAIRGHTLDLLAAELAVRADLARLGASARDVRAAVQRAATSRTALVPDVARRLEAPIRASLDSIAAAHVSSRLPGAPVDLRVALANAAESETAGALMLLESIAALQVAQVREATVAIVQADSLLDVTAGDLDGAQASALADLAAREGELGDTLQLALRVFAVWAILGVALALVGAWVVRQRLVLPIVALERAVSNITGGDLSTEVHVRGGDELGTLGAHFNAMAGVLRERAEDELRHRENLTERFGRILDESSNEIYLFDADSLRIVQANRGARANLGYTLAELAERTPLDLLRGVPSDAFLGALSALRTGERTRIVLSGGQARKDGTLYPAEIALQLSSVSDPPVFVAVVEDLNERGAMRTLSERLRQFAIEQNRLLGAGDLVAAAREISTMVADTLRAERAGVWRFESGRLSLVDLFDRTDGHHVSEHAVENEQYPEIFESMAQGGVIAIPDAQRDPRTRNLGSRSPTAPAASSLMLAPVRVGGRVVAVVSVAHIGEPRHWTAESQAFAASAADFVAFAIEAADRRRAEEALRDSEARYRAAFEQAGVGVLEVSPERRYLRVNQRFCDMVGYTRDELIGASDTEITHPDDRRLAIDMMVQLSAGTVDVYRREKRYIRKDGTEVYVNATAAPVRGPDGAVRSVVTIIEDTSERRRLESQLAQAQRIDSIGRLAGGVAHDFNNLLTAILGYLELAKSGVPADGPVYADLQEIELAARRAADLTSQLLTFARRQVVAPKVIDLTDLARNADRLLRRLIGEDIELVTILKPGLGAVRVDPGQFEQVLVNLVVNARDAMPTGGRITIQSDNVDFDETYAAAQPDVAAGPYVQLAVTDNGTGMDKATVARLFEPFFTTKSFGRGTGLGLATSYGIIRQAGGHIAVDSEPDRGTTFRVCLPRVDAVPEPVATGRAVVSLAAPRGHETILVVEDEAQVRQLTENALRSLGYVVISAGNGEEGLTIARRRLAEIDLLVTDVALPLLGGRELVSRLRADRPGLPVIYVSGYTRGTVQEADLLEPDVIFLAKPFTQGELAHRVRELLDRHGARQT